MMGKAFSRVATALGCIFTEDVKKKKIKKT